ncbi:hypothetical protein HGO21_00370 [Acinetobacter sp. CUI P1]|nr:hypothetical protein [Acinetobacter sp. CUI P1]
MTEKSTIKKPLSQEKFNEEYQKKADILKDFIINRESGEGTIYVFNHEAGFGKSRITDEVLQQEVLKTSCTELPGNDRRFLLVKKFKKDVLQSEETISSRGRFIDDVLGITAENWTNGAKWRYRKEQLKQFKVLIITHSRYISMCTDEEERQALMDGRHTLIIDEKVEFPIYSFNKSQYLLLQKHLPPTDYLMLNQISTPLFEEMAHQKCRKKKDETTVLFNNEILTCKPKLENKEILLSEIRNVINRNADLNINNTREALKIVKALEQIYGSKCLFNGDKISTISEHHKFLLLKNNIILDANGEIDALYSEQLSDKFISKRQTKIIYHDKCEIQHLQFNTSKSSIAKLEKEYFSKIINLMKKEHKQGDKTLIVMQKRFVMDENKNEASFLYNLQKNGIHSVFVGSEDEENKYNNESYAVNWFGNLIGKNDWRDFNQCWVIGTPLLPMDTYILNMWQYSGNINWKIGREIVKKEGVQQFKNKDLEKIRKGYIVGEIYQAIKRIQRNHHPKAQFFIVNNDDDVFNKVVKHLPNVQKRESIDLDIKSQKNRERLENIKKKKENKALEILDVVLSKSPGSYKKSSIEEEAGIPKGKLSRYFKIDLPELSAYIDVDFKIVNKEIIRL